jgi:F-type H+-transporting ATPase subunit b
MAVLGSLVIAAEAVSDKKDLYPHLSELIIGAIAFAVVYAFLSRWAIPRLNQILEERRSKIQGDLESAEGARREAEAELARYREQLGNAREESNRIIEEARRTADQLRADLQARAEQEAQEIVARATGEIRAERDRVFQELKAQVGEVAVVLAERMVGASLTKATQQKLIDEFIDQVSQSGNGHRS